MALHLSRQTAGLSEAAKITELMVAVREKGAACERIIMQAMRLPLLSPFVGSFRRALQLSASLRLLLSSLSNPRGGVLASLYGLLGVYKLVHQFLQPFVVAATPLADLQAYTRPEGSDRLARKVAALVRLYGLSLHELSLGVLEAQAALRAQHNRSAEGNEDSGSTDGTGGSSGGDSLAATKQHFLSASMMMPPVGGDGASDGESDFGASGGLATGLQAGLSSPLSMEEDYFGDSSQSPYAVEKVAAARAAEMRQLMHTYREFPLYVPLSAGASHGNTSIGMEGRGRGAGASAAAPPSFCADLFPPSRSPLVLPRDHVPAVRGAEFAALQGAFQRLLVSYGSGANTAGPRVVFLHGDAGLGGQEYAKFVLHNLLLPPTPSPAAVAQAAQVRAAQLAGAAPTHFIPASASGSGLAPPPTSPASYTHNYTPLHFQFTRWGQAEFRRPKEGLLDALQRRIKTASTRSSEREAARRQGAGAAAAAVAGAAGGAGDGGVGGDSEGGAAITSSISASIDDHSSHHTGPSGSASGSGAGSSTSTAGFTAPSRTPPLEKERLHSMHRLRVDAVGVAKSLVSPLALSTALAAGAEWEASSMALASEATVWEKYRRHVLDTPSILLLSNVHKNDEVEIERLLFPPTGGPHDTAPPNPAHLNRAVILVHSRQPLKALMKRCANHAVAQQLCAMDETQSTNAFLKLSEKRAQLRLRQVQAQAAAASGGPLPPSAIAAAAAAHRLAHSIDPGHAIRFGALMRGSIFVGQFLLRQVEYGVVPRGAGPKTAGDAGSFISLHTRSSRSCREVSEWVCASLESKPSSQVSFLIDHCFPSSQRGHIGPAVAFAFAHLSPRAQQLFVATAFALAGVQSFTWRMLKATMMHYATSGADCDTNHDASPSSGGKSAPSLPPLHPEQLESHLRELLGRGFVTQLGELDSGDSAAGANSFVEEGEEEQEREEGEQGRSAAASLDGEEGTAKGAATSAAASAAAAAAAAAPPASFSSLLHARFVMHDIIKEFGLSIAHLAAPSPPRSRRAGSSGGGGGAARLPAVQVSVRDFSRHFGPDLCAQFAQADTAPKFKRALQLHLVNYMSRQVQAQEEAFQAWWMGTSDGKDPAEEEDGEEEDSGQEDDPSAPASAAASPSVRRRTVTLSASPGERAEQLRQRAQLREQLTASLLEDEEAQQAAKQEARRQSRSYSRSSGTRATASDNGAPGSSGVAGAGSRRSTLLMESRMRNEPTSLPASSMRSLPLAPPTEMVVKTVKRLRALAEEEDEQSAEHKEDGDQAPRASSPSSSCGSPPSSDGEEVAGRDPQAEWDECSSDEAEEDAACSALPLADEDDVEPEAALSQPAVALPLRAPSESEAAAAGAGASMPLSPSGSHRRNASAATLNSVLVALAAVEEQEESEEDDGMQALGARARTRSLAPATAAAIDASCVEETEGYDAADFSDSSDEEYEAVSLSPSFLSRASVAARLDAGRALVSEEARLLEAMDAADAALREAERLAAQENERLDREARAWEADCGDVVDHGRATLPSLRACSALHRPVSLPSLVDETAAPMRLAELATAVMQAVRPVRPARRRRLTHAPAPGSASASAGSARSRIGGGSGGGRARTGTVFAPDAAHTPSFIRALQLGKLLFAFDLDLTALLQALRSSHNASKHNLTAVSLWSPRAIVCARLSNDHCKLLAFRFLEVCKPRYSRPWIHALVHLAQCYRSMGQLHKARDCLEEVRLVAVRQKGDGVVALLASQVGVASVHQAQLCAGRVAKFGSWIDHYNTATAATGVSTATTTTTQQQMSLLSSGGAGLGALAADLPLGVSVDGNGGGGGIGVSSLAYPHATPFNREGSTLTSSASAASFGTAESFVVSPSMLGQVGSAVSLQHQQQQQHGALLAQPHADVGHIHAVLDAILENYERALSTLESNSLLLLSAAVEASEGSDPLVQRGMHVFARPLMFLLLRLGTFYTYKGAFHNGVAALRRAVEIKAGEVAFHRERRARARRMAAQRRDKGQGQGQAQAASSVTKPAFLQSRDGGGGGGPGVASRPSLSSLLPFALPSSTRLLVHVFFALGLVYFRAGDPEEGAAHFERARLVQARLIARRFWREKSDKDSAWQQQDDTMEDSAPSSSSFSGGSGVAGVDSSSGAAPCESASAFASASDVAWTHSSSFLSSLATPAQAADLFAYVRCVYMLACSHDRIAGQMQQQQAQQAETGELGSDSSGSSAPDPPSSTAPSSSSSPSASASSASYHSYRALVLRQSVVSLWTRVTAGHKVMSMHEDMWRVCTGMSVLDCVQ